MAGYAMVRLPYDDNPNHGNVIRVAPGSNVVPAHAGNVVRRSPLLVVNEPEPGAAWPGDLSNMMFLPDGRLVPANDSVVDMFRGPEFLAPAGGGFAAAIRTLIPAAAMFAGGFAGYRMSENHKGWGALTGAIVGGILGRLFR